MSLRTSPHQVQDVMRWMDRVYAPLLLQDPQWASLLDQKTAASLEALERAVSSAVQRGGKAGGSRASSLFCAPCSAADLLLSCSLAAAPFIHCPPFSPPGGRKSYGNRLAKWDRRWFVLEEGALKCGT